MLSGIRLHKADEEKGNEFEKKKRKKKKGGGVTLCGNKLLFARAAQQQSSQDSPSHITHVGREQRSMSMSKDELPYQKRQ